jgi:hypothetical protein
VWCWGVRSQASGTRIGGVHVFPRHALTASQPGINMAHVVMPGWLAVPAISGGKMPQSRI